MAKKLKLSTKLIGGFLLVALIIAIVGAVGIFGVIKTGKSFDICMDKEVPMADSSMEGTIAIISGRDLMGEFLLTEDPTELDGIEKEFSRVNQEFKEFNNYIMTKGNESLKALSVQAGQYHDDFKTNAIELIKHQREHIDYEKKSESVMKDFDTHVASLRNLLIEFEQKLTTGAEIDEQLDAAMEAKAIMFQQQALAEEYMGLESLNETEKLRKNFKALESEFDELETHLPAEVVERHAAFGKLAMSMFALHDQTMRMNLETRSHMTLVDEFSTKTAQTFEEIEKAAADSMKKTMVTADATESLVIWLITIVSIAGFLLGAVFGVLISRNISRPIMRIVESLGSGSDQVSSASGQVASSSQDLAEGASEQAASLEETSSSLEEMSSMTRQNAENAAQANSLMDEAKGVISRAASSMKKMTNAMSQISESGQEINKIIKTIDEIAFQTNLLALNAAVEAARAGEAGAGFAVVADEVRNLAMRAAEAAKNTAGLIEGTINQINIGTDLVQATDEAFSEVNQSASKVADLVGEIAAASTEQAQGIDQINQAISQMDKVVQNSAAGAEEGASAAEEMNAMADSMQQLVTELSAVVHGSTHDVQRQSQPHNKIAPGTFTEATEAGRIVILEDGYDAF